jgi:predicted ATPase
LSKLGCKNLAQYIREWGFRSAIAWSYDLLMPEAQTLFRHLSVVAGGCTLDAAEAIWREMENGKWEDDPTPSVSRFPTSVCVIDLLDSLVAKSLLFLRDGPEDPRYVMLETIRELAAERLAASGEEAIVRQQHAAYYLAMVETAGAMLFASAETRARLAADHADVQAALQWLVQHG